MTTATPSKLSRPPASTEKSCTNRPGGDHGYRPLHRLALRCAAQLASSRRKAESRAIAESS